MPEDIFAPLGVKGIRSMAGSITHAAATGISLGTLLERLQESTRAMGGRWTAATTRAVETRYSAAVDQARKGQSIARTPPNVLMSTRWVSFADLRRDSADFRNSPRYRVTYHGSGSHEGLPFERFKTTYFTGLGALPATIGELRDQLWQHLLNSGTDSLLGAEGSILEANVVAI